MNLHDHVVLGALFADIYGFVAFIAAPKACESRQQSVL